MNWEKQNEYWMKNGNFTISKAHSNVPKPYALHRGNPSKGYRTIGFYATSEAAIKKHEQLTKGKI